MKPLFRTFLFLFLSACFLHLSAIAYASERRDGNWWITQRKIDKDNYIVGFFDGMDLGHNFSVWNFIQNPPASDRHCLNKVKESFTTYQRKYFKNVTNLQISDGLDDFYSDYKNRRIKVSSAISLVINGIAGTPEDELNRMIENFRKNAN